MEEKCEFCREAIEKGAKKCKKCGEPFYFTGKVLKFIPLFSIVPTFLSLVITLSSLGYAYLEREGRVEAVKKTEVAVAEKVKAGKKAEVAVAEKVEAVKQAAVEREKRNLAERVNLELKSRDIAATQALRDMAAKLRPESKDAIINNIGIPSKEAFKKLEKDAKIKPLDRALQRKLYLYRAIKRPG